MDSDSSDSGASSPIVRRSDFYPVGPLSGKRNYKRFLKIERDGSLRETVHLQVADLSHREFLVCAHYVRFRVRFFAEEDVGVNVLGRDCPWDFKLQLSTGEEFFLEITSIADHARHFEINKREERLAKWVGAALIPFHELRKLASYFSSEELARAVSQHAREGRHGSELVVNPLRDSQRNVFWSIMPPPAEALDRQIMRAVERKAAKTHDHKDATVLVIDNRTTAFDFSDYRNATEKLESELANFPFPEIWFYTGYYSDDDGNNAEFSFAPLKVSAAQANTLAKMERDSRGMHIWGAAK